MLKSFIGLWTNGLVYWWLVVSEWDCNLTASAIFHISSNLGCIIFSDVFSKHSRALHQAAIGGQCWPPRSKYRQLGPSIAEGERETWEETQKNKQIDEIQNVRKNIGGRQEVEHTDGGRTQGQLTVYHLHRPYCSVLFVQLKPKCVLSLSRCTITHLLHRDTWLLWPI